MTEEYVTCEVCDEDFGPDDVIVMVRGIPCHEGGCAESMEDEQRAYDEEERNDPDSPFYLIDGVGFADPGGDSALRAATEDNPRDQPCPTCKREHVLTRIDVLRGYQCDACARAAEMGIESCY